MGQKPGAKAGRVRGVSGGRNVRRVLGLIEAALLVIDELYFPARVMAYRAQRALRGQGGEADTMLALEAAIQFVDRMSRVYRSLYSLRETDETTTGQLVLPLPMEATVAEKQQTRRRRSRTAAAPVLGSTGAAITS